MNAIPYLHDITTIHTDPNLASLRADLLRGVNAVSDDVVRAFEIYGIAKAVAARFSGTPQHHAHATRASLASESLFFEAWVWFRRTAGADAGASAPASGDGDAGYRAFLLTRLDWVHEYGTVHDRASANASTCLCPVTAYLQLILRHTPMDDWAAAASTADPDESPLAFAWAWARRTIGRRTADVAVLVTMGHQVRRMMMAYNLKPVEKSTASKAGTKLLDEGVWEALAVVAKDCLTAAATRLRHSPQGYKHVPESDDGLAIVQKAAEALSKEGERYALLLEEKDVDQEREAVVSSIRTLAAFILGKAEPTPEKVLLAVNGLATEVAPTAHESYANEGTGKRSQLTNGPTPNDGYMIFPADPAHATAVKGLKPTGINVLMVVR
ncbi:hypothetical protein GGX14DRAFT_655600 [Mycena pura]|uniref:Uncharacterized protein n=1 Tax=Mycena pura TaxID=153505 RepID=A0AAD6Y6B7_9AGAR|nr:hypothetical protein GGX14DRAFT_655600 [Mycena pura]